MNRLKVVYLISEIQKSLAFEWIAKSIDPKKFELSFILLGRPNTEIANELRKLNVKVIEFPLGSRFNVVISFFRVLTSLFGIKPDVIHTHLFYANLIGLSAGWLLGVPKRIVTRHHAMVHYDEYPQGLKWDKYINLIASHVIAISQNTKKILTLLDHGFDIDYFQNVSPTRVQELKNKYGTQNKYPVVGMISRYLALKGIPYAITAFKQLIEDFPNAHLVLANANGNYKAEIKKALQSLPEGSFTEIDFENELAALYKLFDVYVHVPKDALSEAFGQTYVEALISGIPSVFTLSGVAPEFIIHEFNALVVPFQNSEAIHEAIVRILSEPQLRSNLGANGKLSANLFSINNMISSLTKLYAE